MSKEKLIEIAKLNKEYAENGTMRLVEDIVKVPASNYYDTERWEKEIDLIFKRITSCSCSFKGVTKCGRL